MSLPSAVLTQTFSTIDLVELKAVHEARRSFWAFRQYINPKMKKGWWQKEISGHLQQFHVDLREGKRPKLVIQAPPQHGKSEQVVEFIAWASGHNPDMKTVYASFSERLGIRANLKLQRLITSEKYRKVFPDTRLGKSSTVVGISGQYRQNQDQLEFADHIGSFRNTTVLGSINGEGLDLGVIDDPIKGRKEAGSASVRNSTWDWFTDVFFSRFSDDAGLLFILTRWHIDDPVGRFVEKFGDAVKVVSHAALALDDETHRKRGEPLFPEHKSLEFLLERKQAMSAANWLSLYQQTPIVVGGDLIQGKWFGRWSVLPAIKRTMIFADTAQKTAEHNDFSVLQCWGHGDDGRIYLLDQLRGKWEAPELARRMVAFWEKWQPEGCSKIMVEDKASGTGLIQDLKGAPHRLPIFGIQRNIDKTTRVQDAVPHIEIGNVMIPASAPWVSDFIIECEAFTADNTHQHDDQIDPMCDAIKEFLQTRKKQGFFN